MAPEYAMASCSSGSFLRVSQAHEMDCISIDAKNPLRAPVRQKSDTGLVKTNENSRLSQPLPTTKTDAKQSVVATRSSSLTLNIPVRKASRDALGNQSIPRRHSSCSNQEPQLNAQWDHSKTTTAFQTRKANPLLLKTSRRLPDQEVPEFIPQKIHLMSTRELLEMAMDEVPDC
jgi:hypothetical protein